MYYLQSCQKDLPPFGEIHVLLTPQISQGGKNRVRDALSRKDSPSHRMGITLDVYPQI